MASIQGLELTQLRRLPWLVTSKVAPLSTLAVSFFLLEVAWQSLRPVSLEQIPDLGNVFARQFGVAAALLLAWTLWPRRFSVLDRFGRRHPVIERLELVALLSAAGLLLGTPFVASSVLSSRLAELRPTDALIEDINHFLRGFALRTTRWDGLGGTVDRYWPADGHAPMNPTGTVRSTRGIPEILSLEQAEQSAEALVEGGYAGLLESEIEEMIAVVQLYTPDACVGFGGGRPKAKHIAAYLLKKKEGFFAWSQDAWRDPGAGGVECLSQVPIPRLTGQLLRSKGLDDFAVPFRQRFILAYAFALVVASVACVYLLGTRLIEFGKWLFSRGLLILGALFIASMMSRRDWEDAALVPLLVLIVGIFIASPYRPWKVRREGGYVGAWRDCIFLLPPLALLLFNLQVMAEIIDDSSPGVPGLFAPVYERSTWIEWLALVFVPYGLGLHWLRNLRLARCSRPGAA